MTDNHSPGPETPAVRYGLCARLRVGRARARDADTASRRRELHLEKELDDYRTERRAAAADGGRGRRRPGPVAELEAPSWTGSKVLWALGLGACFAVVIVVMAIAAIAFQTGFLNTILPEEFRQIGVFFLDVPIELAKTAPVALEFTAWVLALTTVVLALRGLPYGKWHRLMWGISLFVAVSNGWHIAAATGNVSLGFAYGAFSIIGPMMIHYYVLFLVLLRSGVSVRQALTEARNDLWLSVFRVAAVVAKVVLGFVFHPVITVRTVSIMSGHPQLTYMQARWIANARYRQRLVWEIRGVYAQAGRPPWGGWDWSALLSRLPWLPRRHLSDTTPADGGVRPAVPGVQLAEPQPELPVATRPETPLTGVRDDEPHGDVLVAARDPEDGLNGGHGGVHGVLDDVGVHEFLAVLESPAGFRAELEELARTLGTPPSHGVQHGPHGGAPGGEHAGNDAVPGGARPGVQPTGGVRDERAGRRAPSGANGSTSAHAGGHHTPGARVQHPEPDRSGAGSSRAGGGGHDDRAAESTAARAYEDGLIITAYWRRVHDGVDVHAVNRKELARELFGPEPDGAKDHPQRSRVSRIWKACINGAWPDPDPGYPERMRAAQRTER